VHSGTHIPVDVAHLMPVPQETPVHLAMHMPLVGSHF
jgi:hypothetical protein